MPDESPLLEAEFDPRVRTYWLLSGAIVLVVTIVGIPLLPLWYWFGRYFTGRYLRRLQCTLTDRTLQVSKGVLNRVEKTIPLDKITDLGYFQGPIMRYLGIDGLTVETAGQSSSEGALVKLHGVVDARDFRDAVLRQRDVMMASTTESPAAAVRLGESPEAAAGDGVLLEIRDTLQRIESHLSKPDS